ncbi:MAG: C39 family peptidase [Gemmataceae bacterium]|nr:C39 family peptidase [Gemmataceae bacterium]
MPASRRTPWLGLALSLLLLAALAAAFLWPRRAMPEPEPDVARLPGIQVVEEKTQAVRAAEGGSVELADGLKVEFPAGALSSDAEVRVRRLSFAGAPPDSLRLVDISTGNASLREEALVTLPCPGPRPARAPEKPAYRVCHIHGDERSELPAEYDHARHAVRVRCKRFSPLAVVAGLFGAYEFFGHLLPQRGEPALREAVKDGGPGRLPIPYYNQDGTEWCMVVSAQMLLKAHGHDKEAWELARAMGLDTETGVSPLTGLVLQGLTRPFKDHGLEVEHNFLPWKEPWPLASYLVERLKEGRPVFLDIQARSHAIVAVGYDDKGIYLHDPSGAITNDITGEMVGTHLHWDSFAEMCREAWINGNVWTLSVRSPRPAVSPVTLQLMPDEFSFQRPPVLSAMGTALDSYFKWDGTVGDGYRFQQGPGDAMHPGHPSASDRFRLKLRVSNAGPAQAVTVSATLAGQPLGKAWNGNAGERSAITEADLTPVPAALPGKASPGRAKLVAVAKVGTEVVDSLSVEVDLGPSRVEGVKVAKKGSKRVLSWKPLPEDGIEYQVRLVADRTGLTADGTLRKQIAGTEWELDAETLAGGKPRWLMVRAIHLASKLHGPPSELQPVPSGDWLAEQREAIARALPELKEFEPPAEALRAGEGKRPAFVGSMPGPAPGKGGSSRLFILQMRTNEDANALAKDGKTLLADLLAPGGTVLDSMGGAGVPPGETQWRTLDRAFGESGTEGWNWTQSRNLVIACQCRLESIGDTFARLYRIDRGSALRAQAGELRSTANKHFGASEKLRGAGVFDFGP